MKRQLSVEPLPSREPLIGSWMAYLEDCRARTKETIEKLVTEQLDFSSPQHKNSIGTLLYHITLIEADWLYAEILQQEYPEILKTWLPWDHRDTLGNLSIVSGWELEQYLQLLDNVRKSFMATLADMTLSDFRRSRSLPDYDVTPEWVCLHLLEHEASHRGQIERLKDSIKDIVAV
jgi:uncharacterized damage-inducible protein DinB